MIPILYSSVTEGTVPSDFGKGVLTDTLECFVSESRNAEYELTLVYPSNGIHASDIILNAFIKAKPNFTDNPQLFRIYKIGKTINGKFEVNAQHISYDLSGKVISFGTANNIVTAIETVLQSQAGNFTLLTTKSTVGKFNIGEPSSVRSWFGGKEGSVLDIYGGGEWHYDNYTCTLANDRGMDRGVSIRYGKNLTELNQEINASNLYTHILCYYKGDDGTVVSGQEVATGLPLDVNKVLTLDVTSEFQSVPTEQNLTDYATAYVGTHNLTVPLNNITLDFVQNGNLSDRVDLCDIVTVYFEALGISAKFKCIRTKWDVLNERYTETEFGDARQSIADTMNSNNDAIASAIGEISSVITIANSKSKVFASTPIPPYNVRDLWVDDGTVYYCVTARGEDYVSFLGETSSAIYDGDTTNPIIINGESVTATTGDVATVVTIVDDETIRDDYVWNGTSWVTYEGYIRSDWDLATNYVDSSDLEDSINKATTILTGGVGGNVLLNYKDMTIDEITVRVPYEILILCDADNLEDATQIWRWNENGLGYSHNGYAGPYDTAITIDENGNGQINADFITTGRINAQTVNIRNLTATSFIGDTIVLGGSDDCKLEVHDTSNPPKILIRIDGEGMECFGEEIGGKIPSVTFDKNGVTGYSDSTDRTSKIFWTHSDEFHMKNGVVENELAVGGMLRFVPVTVGSFEGIVIVPVV